VAGTFGGVVTRSVSLIARASLVKIDSVGEDAPHAADSAVTRVWRCPGGGRLSMPYTA
jgi:hypothetical protein